MERGEERSGVAWWIAAVVTIGAVLMAVGGVLAVANPGMLVGAHTEMTPAARVFAGYFAARNLAIAALLLGALAWRMRGALTTLLVLACVVQAADLVMDGAEGRWSIVPGVLAVGVGFFVAALGTRRTMRA